MRFRVMRVFLLKNEFNFIVIPAGSGRTTCRHEDSIMNKKSVLRIVNDDKNCFWYAMACLMKNPNNRQIRPERQSDARTKAAREICSKSKLEWNKPTPLHFICLVEEAYNININVIDKYNVPMLGCNVNIFNCLMYKSENRHTKHYFLRYDSINEHYDAISDIKKFLAVRVFCFNCFKGFINKSDSEKHECDTNLSKKKKVDKKTEFKMVKELSHYLTRGFTKGSEES